jgi:hypothetical protein
LILCCSAVSSTQGRAQRAARHADRAPALRPHAGPATITNAMTSCSSHAVYRIGDRVAGEPVAPLSRSGAKT